MLEGLNVSKITPQKFVLYGVSNILEYAVSLEMSGNQSFVTL